MQLSVELDDTGEALRLAVSSSAGAPDDAVRADEDEPWWALMGNPLVAAWQAPAGSAHPHTLELQFREDTSRPKLVTIQIQQGHLRISARAKEPARP